MNTDLLIVVVFLGLGGLLVRWAASAGPVGDALLAGMFRAPDPGWPSGVEEEDDQHWSRSSPMADGGRSAVAVEPVRLKLRTRLTVLDATWAGSSRER